MTSKLIDESTSSIIGGIYIFSRMTLLSPSPVILLFSLSGAIINLNLCKTLLMDVQIRTKSQFNGLVGKWAGLLFPIVC